MSHYQQRGSVEWNYQSAVRGSSLDLLQALSSDDFASVHRSPPLLYHNDLTASVPRFYWSEEFGYALWLRLYFANLRRDSAAGETR